MAWRSRAGASADAASVREPILHERPDGGDAVAPGDLLAVLVSAAVIRNRDLVHTIPALENFGGELRFDAESIRSEGHRTQDVDAHGFETRFHVGEHRVV